MLRNIEMSVNFGSFVLIGVLALLVVVIVAAFLTRRAPADSAALSPRRLVEVYLFTVVLVAMLLVSGGLASLVRASIATRFGLDTSYRPQAVWSEDYRPGEKPKFQYDTKATRRDVFSGSAELGVGLIVGLLHLAGLRRMGRTEPLTNSPVYRLFLIIALVIYTTAVLIYAVGSVKDVLLYRYVGLPPVSSWYDRPLPGDQIAGLVGFLPLWVALVPRLLRYARARTTA